MAQLPDSLKPLEDPEKLAELRGVTGLKDGNGATDHALGMILAAVDADVDLAATAIVMRPRPAWVAEMLGPSLGLGD